MTEMDRFASDADRLSDGPAQMPSPHAPEPSRERMLAIAALADGSSDSAELRAEIEADPHARALLDEQTRAVELVRAAVADVRAPDMLRERLAVPEPQPTLAREARRRARRPAERGHRASRRGGALAGLLGAAAAIALVLVLTLSGPGGSPTVAQAAALSTQPATLSAPRHLTKGSDLLNRSGAGVPFPYWEDHFQWRATGARTDTLRGRQVTTVFYSDGHGRHLAYSIVSGAALTAPAGAQRTVRNGVEMWTVEAGATTIVTWERDGHSCVLASRIVPGHTLQALAGWRANGSIPY